MLVDIPDHLTRAGPLQLAQRLREFWAARGFQINVWVAEDGVSVRSNLFGGLPPERFVWAGNIAALQGDAKCPTAS